MTPATTLVIGNKNYSSWSLRPWILMKTAGIDFTEVKLSLYAPDSKQKLLRYSPAGKVPVLIHGQTTCWDSLAICEYLHELYPQQGLWPADGERRALARSISNEMHSSFPNIRESLPMNCRRTARFNRMTAPLQNEIDRVCSIWRDCLADHTGKDGFLFGSFSIADAMYAPVVSRFSTYAIAVGDLERSYMSTVLALPSFKVWHEEARQETEVADHYEIDVD